jgi:hypothetical protein
MSRVNRRFEYLFISSEKVIQEEIRNEKRLPSFQLYHLHLQEINWKFIFIVYLKVLLKIKKTMLSKCLVVNYFKMMFSVDF